MNLSRKVDCDVRKLPRANAIKLCFLLGLIEQIQENVLENGKQGVNKCYRAKPYLPNDNAIALCCRVRADLEDQRMTYSPNLKACTYLEQKTAMYMNVSRANAIALCSLSRPHAKIQDNVL